MTPKLAFAYQTISEVMFDLRDAEEEYDTEAFVNCLDKLIDICHESIDMIERS